MTHNLKISPKFMFRFRIPELFSEIKEYSLTNGA